MQGVDRFLIVRYSSRLFASKWALQRGVSRTVLDLTAGWGRTQKPYLDAGFQVVGVDKDAAAKGATFHMRAERFIEQQETLPFGVIDFEPYGMATAILSTLFENSAKLEPPVVLCVGCNPRNVVLRVGSRTNWWDHLRSDYPHVLASFGMRQLETLFSESIKTRAKEVGLTFTLGENFKEPDMRKLMCVGLLE